MSFWFFKVRSSALFMSGVLVLSSSGVAQVSGGLAEYSIRADPKYADRINAVLASVAEPTEYKLPNGSDADAFFKEICGSKKAVKQIGNRQEGDFNFVTAAPCLESRQNIKVKLLPGSKLESVAVRLGLAPSSASELKIISAASGQASRVFKAQNIKANASVLVPSVPVWTKIEAKQDLVPDRDTLVGKISAALSCGSEKAEACLAKRGVVVVRKEALVPKLPAPIILRPSNDEHAPTSTAPDNDVVPEKNGGAPHNFRFISNIVPFRTAAKTAIDPKTRSRGLTVAQDGGTPTAVTPADVRPASLHVADDQWPYNAGLVAALIKDLRSKNVELLPTTVGVADIGMASGQGAPLPLEMFHITDSETVSGSDVSSDSAPSDAAFPARIGRGTARPGPVKALAPSHDVGLCSGKVDFSSWNDADRRFASHGAIVASLAGGYPLWKGHPEIRSTLPPVSFFRLVGEVCEPGKPSSISVSDMIDGFEFLFGQTNIVSISFINSTSAPDQFVNTVKTEIPYDTRFLFIPAGNNQVNDLDEDGSPCPPCLMQTSNEPAVRERVFVIGAATADLKRASYSSYGSNAVEFYAPGEPVGAVDVLGNPADINDQATSYATPYAAFATALLSSIGRGLDRTSVASIRARLSLSTWRLDNDPESKAGVIDLIKVAAARHHTVEVLEGAETGHPVLRDYVGNIVAGTEGICNGTVDLSNIQAVRFGAADINGNRKVQHFLRDFPIGSHTLAKKSPICRPSGNLTLLQLDGHQRSIDLKSVTQILFSWNKSPLKIAAQP